MKDQLVKDWMTAQVVTIQEDATLPDAHEVMKEYGIRRLPVVNASGKLVGLVSQTDVREAEPSDATTLSIYELHYLLARLQVKKIMTENPRVVTPETSMAEVARILLEYKFGGLPVMEDDNLVGMVTESDVFRMVVQLYAE